jgi:2-haloacid dehalogenase
MQPVLVFDVNETLLDVSGLDPFFTRLFGEPVVRREWFGQMLQGAFVSTITNAYRDFGSLGASALEMVAAHRGVEIAEEHRVELGATMRRLPPHPDVRPGMEMLRSAGFRLATLTNSTLEVGRAQLANAGLDDLLEHMLSADEVRRLKPAPEPYLMAAERLGVPASSVTMVAAHAWDISGALHAGLQAAFVARPGQQLYAHDRQPAIVERDLRGIAVRIITLTNERPTESR